LTKEYYDQEYQKQEQYVSGRTWSFSWNLLILFGFTILSVWFRWLLRFGWTIVNAIGIISGVKGDWDDHWFTGHPVDEGHFSLESVIGCPSNSDRNGVIV
jgi:hypothetical protein